MPCASKTGSKACEPGLGLIQLCTIAFSGPKIFSDADSQSWVSSNPTAHNNKCVDRQEITMVCEATRHHGVERYQSITTLGVATESTGESFISWKRLGQMWIRVFIRQFQSKFHCRVVGGGSGSGSSSGSEQPVGTPISSLIHRYKSANLQRSEQNGIWAAVTSAVNGRPQVGHFAEKLDFDMPRE